MKEIFITGGTGYMGTRLIPRLLARGYSVNALVRKGSGKKVLGFDTFTHYKSVFRKPNWFELNLKYFPHTKRKLQLIKFIMSLK